MRPDIDAIESRENKATPGPWEPDNRYVLHNDTPFIRQVCTVEETLCDAEFIAHARTDIPALIAYIRELEAEICRRCHREKLPYDAQCHNCEFDRGNN